MPINSINNAGEDAGLETEFNIKAAREAFVQSNGIGPISEYVAEQIFDEGQNKTLLNELGLSSAKMLDLIFGKTEVKDFDPDAGKNKKP